MSDKNPKAIELRRFEVTVPTSDGLRVAERVPIFVPMEYDGDLEEWIITPEGRQLIQDTKARHMGLLLPHELKSLREHLDVTQEQIADILKIGRKSWTRWESGRQRPSQSVNLFLRALQTGKLSLYDLQALDSTSPQPNWNAIIQSKPIGNETASMPFLDDDWSPLPGEVEREQQPLAA